LPEGRISDRFEAGAVGRRRLAQRLVDQAKAEGISLTGPGCPLGCLTKRVLETALEGELDEHLGYAKQDPAGRSSSDSRNGKRSKTVVTEVAPVELDVPRDRDGTFEPKIVRMAVAPMTRLDDTPEDKAETVGLALPQIEVKVIDPVSATQFHPARWASCASGASR
jgi:Transposase, Mutator family